MLDYNVVKNWDFGEISHAYTVRDSLLYALGIGMGGDPTDPGQLRFSQEIEQQVVPTMAAVLGTPGHWWRNPATGVDWVKLLHGEQDSTFFKPLPAAGTVIARNRVLTVADKGTGRGAVAEVVRELFDDQNGELLARAKQVSILRGDGGFSAGSGQSDPLPALLPAITQTGAPEATVDLASLPQAALIYRLSGDMNPLHSDPQTARAAGYTRPILHGLCSYGMAAHAVLQQYCGYEATRLRRLAARFSAPVFPGETLQFQFWRSGMDDTALRFRARVLARDVTVLDHGIAEIDAN